MSDASDFFFERLAVGSFVGGLPRQDGRHRYEPYRGEGHYRLATLLRRGSAQRCYYDVGEQRFFFTVIGLPEYGVLELSEFDTPVAVA